MSLGARENDIILNVLKMADSVLVKKQKTCSDQESTNVDTNHKRLVKHFQITEVLNQNAQVKSIVLRGRYSDKPDDAVLILEKTPFSVDSVKEVFCEETGVEVILQNDIYNSMKIFPPPFCNGKDMSSSLFCRCCGIFIQTGTQILSRRIDCLS